jgi:hypothetical protein
MTLGLVKAMKDLADTMDQVRPVLVQTEELENETALEAAKVMLAKAQLIQLQIAQSQGEDWAPPPSETARLVDLCEQIVAQREELSILEQKLSTLRIEHAWLLRRWEKQQKEVGVNEGVWTLLRHGAQVAREESLRKAEAEA